MRLVLSLLLVVTGLAAPAGAARARTATTRARATSAAPAGTTTTTTTTAAPPTTTSTTQPPPRISDVDQQFLYHVRAELGSAQEAYDLAVGNQVTVDQGASEDAGRFELASQQVSQLDGQEQQAAARVTVAHNRLRDFAVAAYVTGGATTPIAALLGSGSIGDFTRRRAVFGAVVRQSEDELTAYEAARQQAAHGTLVAVDQLETSLALRQISARAAAGAAQAVQQAAALVASRRQLLTLATDALTVGGTDIPRMVLDAYQRAALSVQAQGCRLAWWGVAAIGRIESDHGRHEDGGLEANGDVVPPILGPALDGTNGTVATPAADGGRRTGDPKWDHAIGPMQFIASTWRRWSADGNGDGVANPNNVYDASLATARYLCSASRDLDTPAGLRTAYFAYNHSDSYVADALGYAALYEGADAGGAVPPLAPVPLYLQGTA